MQPDCPSLLAGHSCRRHSAGRADGGLPILQKQRFYRLTRGCGACRGARLLFGDQTLFCRACDFRRAGGYASRLPIMEDADLCIRLHMAGPGVLSCTGDRSCCHLSCCGLWCCSIDRYRDLAGHVLAECTPFCYRQLVCDMLDRYEPAGCFLGRQQMNECVPGKAEHASEAWLLCWCRAPTPRQGGCRDGYRGPAGKKAAPAAALVSGGGARS